MDSTRIQNNEFILASFNDACSKQNVESGMMWAVQG
jgi:hypothetical protein